LPLNSDTYINNNNNNNFYQNLQNLQNFGNFGNFPQNFQKNEIPINTINPLNTNYTNLTQTKFSSSKNSNVKIDEKTKIQNNDMWKKRYSQNPYFFDRVNKEDEYMLQEHLHNLKKKEGKNLKKIRKKNYDSFKNLLKKFIKIY